MSYNINYYNSIGVPGATISYRLESDGRYIYLPKGENEGLYIVDIINPDNPQIISTFVDAINPKLLYPCLGEAENRFLIVSAKNGVYYEELQKIDISDPLNPYLVDRSNVLNSGGSKRIKTYGNIMYAFILTSTNNLLVVNVGSSDGSGEFGSSFLSPLTDLHMADFIINGNYIYGVDTYEHVVKIINISDINNIHIVTTIPYEEPSISYAYLISIENNILYWLKGKSIVFTDITNPSAPIQISSFPYDILSSEFNFFHYGTRNPDLQTLIVNNIASVFSIDISNINSCFIVNKENILSGALNAMCLTGNEYVTAFNINNKSLDIYKAIFVSPTTTTTTTAPVTTTTTTTAVDSFRTLSVKNVQTIFLSNGIEKVGNDSSDNKGTLKTINSTSLSFGPLAPGEVSETMITYLKVPSSLAINNIRLALIDCGGFNFAETKFGIENQSFIDYNIVPSDKFDGININKDENSIYNVAIPNKDYHNSNYVYLNVVVPSNKMFGSGVIRYKWFFDFA